MPDRSGSATVEVYTHLGVTMTDALRRIVLPGAGDGQLADIVSELEAQGSGTGLGRFTPHHPQGA